MSKFDVDRNGVLDFTEFMRALCLPPWKPLLPPEVQEGMIDARTQLRAEQRQKLPPLSPTIPEASYFEQIST